MYRCVRDVALRNQTPMTNVRLQGLVQRLLALTRLRLGEGARAEGASRDHARLPLGRRSGTDGGDCLAPQLLPTRHSSTSGLKGAGAGNGLHARLGQMPPRPMLPATRCGPGAAARLKTIAARRPSAARTSTHVMTTVLRRERSFGNLNHASSSQCGTPLGARHVAGNDIPRASSGSERRLSPPAALVSEATSLAPRRSPRRRPPLLGTCALARHYPGLRSRVRASRGRRHQRPPARAATQMALLTARVTGGRVSRTRGGARQDRRG